MAIATCTDWTLTKTGIIVNGHTYCLDCQAKLNQAELAQAFRLREAAPLYKNESRGCYCEACRKSLEVL